MSLMTWLSLAVACWALQGRLLDTVVLYLVVESALDSVVLGPAVCTFY